MKLRTPAFILLPALFIAAAFPAAGRAAGPSKKLPVAVVVMQAHDAVEKQREKLAAAEQAESAASLALYRASEDAQQIKDVTSGQGAIQNLQQARQQFDQKVQERERTQQSYEQAGNDYLRAENQYYGSVGRLYDYQEYDYWAKGGKGAYPTQGGGGWTSSSGDGEGSGASSQGSNAAASQRSAGSGASSRAGSAAAEKSVERAPTVGAVPARTGSAVWDRPAGLSAAPVSGGVLGPASMSDGRYLAPPGARRGGTPAPDSGRWLDKRVALPQQPSASMRMKSDVPALDGARRKMQSGDRAGALAAVNKLLSAEPGNSAGHALKAKLLNQMHDWKGAELSAKEAVRLEPRRAEAYERMAEAQLMQGKYSEAAENASMALELDPANAHAYHLRALAYEGLGRREPMLADLESASQIDAERFSGELEAARAGERLFDPKADDAWQLVDAVSARPSRRKRIPPQLWFLSGMVLLTVGLSLAAARRCAAARPRRENSFTAMLPKPESEPPAAGLLAGKYETSRIIGRGGMGEVWEALDSTLGRRVALKKLSAELAEDPQARADALREARMIAGLHHPRIVDIYEVLDIPAGLYLVFELLSGKTVQQMLVERRRLSVEETKMMLLEVCEALEYAHGRGVVHRDLKPSNIMLTEAGHVKVMDFGIARRVGKNAPPSAAVEDLMAKKKPEGDEGLFSARTCTVQGTPLYMPPEAEEGLIVPASDVYSLGVCLYEMVTGQAPFGSDALMQKTAKVFVMPGVLTPGLPEKIDALVDAALEPDPKKRISLREFRSRLAA
ncbi:MAG: protein kinase [Elusimicrobiota bacterium]|jgi:tetratricopeptide (TPR) repeat protein